MAMVSGPGSAKWLARASVSPQTTSLGGRAVPLALSVDQAIRLQYQTTAAGLAVAVATAVGAVNRRDRRLHHHRGTEEVEEDSVRVAGVACEPGVAGSRRRWAISFAAVMAGSPSPHAAKAEVSRSEDVIGDIAAGILGPADDVYYPTWFLGDWAATSELVAVEFPQGETLAGKAAVRARGSVGTPRAVENYVQRFIEYRSHIIADRAYNMRGLVRGTAGGPRALESVEWEPSNPNNLVVTLKRDGTSMRTETRVQRRSVGAPDDREDLFNTSELYQEVVSYGDDSVSLSAPLPRGGETKITPIRCVNKFKRVGAGPTVQVLQRVEVFPRLAIRSDGGDPQKPVVIYRYRGVLERPADEPSAIRAL